MKPIMGLLVFMLMSVNAHALTVGGSLPSGTGIYLGSSTSDYFDIRGYISDPNYSYSFKNGKVTLKFYDSVSYTSVNTSTTNYSYQYLPYSNYFLYNRDITIDYYDVRSYINIEMEGYTSSVFNVDGTPVTSSDTTTVTDSTDYIYVSPYFWYSEEYRTTTTRNYHDISNDYTWETLLDDSMLQDLLMDGLLNFSLTEQSGLSALVSSSFTFDLVRNPLKAQEPVPTPEPATILLLGGGLAGLAARKRMKKNS